MPTCECGHSLDDHAIGQSRSYYFCEHGECDCKDFKVPELETLDIKLEIKGEKARLIDKNKLPTGIVISKENAVKYCERNPGWTWKLVE